MATVELVGGHADGDYLHAAELDNLRRAADGCGALTNSISATVTQTDLNITLAAFDYVAPDGSGGRKVVSYAGGTVARSAADATNPANDLLVGDADGNVTLRDGTPTAETGDVEDAPMVTLASDEVVIAKVRRPENSTAVLTTHISPRAVDVSDAWPSKGSDIASASALNLPEAGTYFDVTGTTTITSIESRPAGFEVTLQFDGACQITHNASSLILRGGEDYTTVAGDVFTFVSEGSGNWRERSRLTQQSTGSISSIVQQFIEDGARRSLFWLGPCPSNGGTANAALVGLGCSVFKDGTSASVSPATSGGGWKFSTGSTSGEDAGIFGPTYTAAQDWTMVAKIIPTSAASQSVIVGGSENNNFGDANNLIAFRISATGNIIGVCDSGGSETTRDFGATGDGTVKELRIEVRSGGTIVRFYVDGAKVGDDVTTNIPTGALDIICGIQNSTTADKTLECIEFGGWREA